MLNNILKWSGQSGKEYPYFSYKAGGKLIKAPGSYILATLKNGFWVASYIGQTEDLSEHLQDHENGVGIGEVTTHIHVHINHSKNRRLIELEDLISLQNPPCNKKLQRNYQYSYPFSLIPRYVLEDIKAIYFVEETYWRKNCKTRPYVEEWEDYETYKDAYQLGFTARYDDLQFDDIDSELRTTWENSESTPWWDKASPAIRDAYERRLNMRTSKGSLV